MSKADGYVDPEITAQQIAEFDGPPMPTEYSGECQCEPPYTVLCTYCQFWETKSDGTADPEYLAIETVISEYCSLCGVHEDYHESERCQMYQDEREAEREAHASIARREIAGIAEWHWWTGDAFGWISHGPDELTK